MKRFLVILKDKQAGHFSDELLLAHIKHLKQLQERKCLIVCGPFVDDLGAVLVIRADSYQKADGLVQTDPFINRKYYGNYSIAEFVEANESNHWLLDD